MAEKKAPIQSTAGAIAMKNDKGKILDISFIKSIIFNFRAKLRWIDLNLLTLISIC